eukprot:CAMPEP_0184546478 /NCGR_PEP_ID=MMETSP0199_2-20130426/4978_1 /TAXON_ID=1112570 /ORGANISM="Thraustochytrium sp., Strain LLF1b" /LENGTH=651 /DNA_ID=CAMNT_0026940889 /DNA_START=243 /DNA_END=2195 /DNA_ORIENTATION=+
MTSDEKAAMTTALFEEVLGDLEVAKNLYVVIVELALYHDANSVHYFKTGLGSLGDPNIFLHCLSKLWQASLQLRRYLRVLKYVPVQSLSKIPRMEDLLTFQSSSLVACLSRLGCAWEVLFCTSLWPCDVFSKPSLVVNAPIEPTSTPVLYRLSDQAPHKRSDLKGEEPLENSSSLARASRCVFIAGDFCLIGMTELVSLPTGLFVGGRLIIEGCSNLVRLSNLCVFGDVIISNCANLVSLTFSWKISGSLTVTNCTSLTSIGETLHIDENCSLIDCHTLAALPESLYVGGELMADNCWSLTRLSSNMHIGASVLLSRLHALKLLPDGLRVVGSLSLVECFSLTSLPKGLHVEEDVDAEGCSSLMSIADDIFVGGNLNVKACSSLETLPLSFLDWELCANGSKHEICISGTRLSVDAVDWLTQLTSFNVQFVTSPHQRQDREQHRAKFKTVKQALLFWSNVAGREMCRFPCDLSSSSQQTLLTFLSMLRNLKEFAFKETRVTLARRIITALIQLITHESRAAMIQRIEDSIDICYDKPLWALNQLTLAALVAKARGNKKTLRKLGRRAMRLSIVHDHAQAKMRRMGRVDDVCIYLRFESELKKALGLPVGATQMWFPNYIPVKEAELLAAKSAALSISEASFEMWLEQWPEW